MNTENNDDCGCIQYSALKCMVTSYWDAFPSAAPVVRYKIHKSDSCLAALQATRPRDGNDMKE